MSEDSFLSKHVPAFGKRVHRLGLASTFGLDEDGIRGAFDRGLTYVFYNPTARKLVQPLKEVLKADRERYVVATGPTMGFFPGQLRKRVEKALRVLGTDYLDVFQLYWLGKMSAYSEANVKTLLELKAEGKIRAIGTSIHDRPRAGRLARNSVMDMLMIRYNAAHPGAERDIFPHLAERKPAIVSYTATAWRKLLKPPRKWDGPVPSAGDCYRFCLSSPHVDVALCGPANLSELDENLRVLEKGPLTEEERDWLRRYGAIVHG